VFDALDIRAEGQWSPTFGSTDEYCGHEAWGRERSASSNVESDVARVNAVIRARRAPEPRGFFDLDTATFPDAAERLRRRRVQRSQEAKRTLAAILRRASELIRIGRDEGYEISQPSLADLFRFVRSNNIASRPYIVLVESGNFRAVWKDADGRQVGLQFLGSGEVQFVFLGRPSAGGFARSAGRDTFAGIWRQLSSNGLRALVEK